MIINYIYYKSGQIEYVVIPFDVWDSIKKYVPSTEIKGEKEPDFDPTEFIGMLSHHHFDLEDELQQLRNLWPGDLF
jgi:hypothetical protein